MPLVGRAALAEHRVMKRTWAGLMVIGALTATAIACSSFSSETPAAPDGPDAAADDAPTDTAPLDSGNSGFCAAAAGMHDFCEDFDESSLAADDWAAGTQTVPDAGSELLDKGQAKSLPTSLLVGLSTVGAGGQRSFFLHRNFDQPAMRKIVLSFDLYVDTLVATDAGVRPDALVAGIGDGIYNTDVRIANNAGEIVVSVEEVLPMTGGYYDPLYSFGNHKFAIGAWHRFVLTSDRQNNTLSLSIDGTMGTPPAVTSFHAPNTPAMNLGLDLGAQSDHEGETIKHYFDNVTVDLDR